jgi:Family of unknown function (DUF6508)
MKPEELPNHLASIEPEAWARFYDLTRSIYNEGNFGEIIDAPKRTEAYLEFPQWRYTDKIAEFVKMTYELNIVVPFDWREWKEGQEMINNTEQDYAQHDAVTLCKLITMIVRAERFYEGYLNTCLQNGSVLKIVTALVTKDHKAGGMQ